MEHIEKFNSVMEEYNEAFANAKDEKEKEKVTKKYDPIIDKAEKEMDAGMEAEIMLQDNALEAEQIINENIFLNKDAQELTDMIRLKFNGMEDREIIEHLIEHHSELFKKIKDNYWEIDIVATVKEYLMSQSS